MRDPNILFLSPGNIIESLKPGGCSRISTRTAQSVLGILTDGGLKQENISRIVDVLVEETAGFRDVSCIPENPIYVMVKRMIDVCEEEALRGQLFYQVIRRIGDFPAGGIELLSEYGQLSNPGVCAIPDVQDALQLLEFWNDIYSNKERSESIKIV